MCGTARVCAARFAGGRHREGDSAVENMDGAFSDFSGYQVEELPLNEETLPAIIQVADHLPGGFFIYKAYGDEEILYVNRHMLRICGYESREQFDKMTGGTFRGFVHPADYEKSEKTIRECIDHSDQDLDYVEYRIRRADGSVRWIMDYGHLVHTERYGNVFCVFVDDSTDKNLRAERDRRAAQVIRGLSEEYNSIYLIDLEMKRMLPYSLNNEVSRSMRYAFEGSMDYETTIREFADRYVLPEDRETYLRECSEPRIRQRIADERIYSIIFRRYNERHVMEYVQMTISRADDTDLSRIVMGYKDVTERVEQAKEEQRLREEVDRADAASRAKTTFLFNMSHDIRTPMNAIIGYTTLMEKHMGEPDKLADYMKKIRSSGEFLLELINDVLEMARIESGTMVLDETTWDAYTMNDAIFAAFEAQMAAKGLRFTRSLDVQSRYVTCDGLKLQ